MEPFPSGNKAFIISAKGSFLNVIDIDQFKLIEARALDVPDDRFPHHIYISKDQTKLAVALPAFDFSQGHGALHGKNPKGGVLILNARNGAIIENFDLPFANHNVVFEPNGERIWTTLVSHSGRALAFDLNNGQQLAEIQLDPDPSEIIINEKGTIAAVCSGESTFLQLINLETRQLSKKIKVDLSPSNVWSMSPDSLIVSNALKKSINIVDSKEEKVVDFIDLDFSPGFAAYHQSSKEIWLIDESNSALRVYQKSGNDVWTEIKKIDFPNERAHGLQFIKNQDKVILICSASSKVYLIDSESKQVEAQLTVSGKPNGIAVSEQ